MAVVTIRVDVVSQLSGGTFDVEFSVLVGGVVWQPHQRASGTTAIQCRDNAIAITTILVSAEKERQKMQVGQIVQTGLDLTLV